MLVLPRLSGGILYPLWAALSKIPISRVSVLLTSSWDPLVCLLKQDCSVYNENYLS